MKEIKISETTKNEEKENNIDFITISKLSSSMIFANKNHAIVYSTKQDTIDVAKSNVETQMIKANCNDKEISDTINKEVDIINEEFNMFRLEEF